MSKQLFKRPFKSSVSQKHIHFVLMVNKINLQHNIVFSLFLDIYIDFTNNISILAIQIIITLNTTLQYKTILLVLYLFSLIGLSVRCSFHFYPFPLTPLISESTVRMGSKLIGMVLWYVQDQHPISRLSWPFFQWQSLVDLHLT